MVRGRRLRAGFVLILLDTHVLVWLVFDNPKLGARTRRAIDRASSAGDAAVSAITFWEVGMRVRKGRMEVHRDLDLWRRDLLERGLIEIPIDGSIAARAGLLEDLHGDPADRLIVATALEGHRLVTADEHILAWPGRLNRLDARD